MKVSTENDNNFGYEKITILVDNIPLSEQVNENIQMINFIDKHIVNEYCTLLVGTYVRWTFELKIVFKR